MSVSRPPAKSRGERNPPRPAFNTLARSLASKRVRKSPSLRRTGCEEIGFMDNYNEHAVLLAFTHRGRRVQLNASAKGWAQLYLKVHPWRLPPPRHAAGL